MESATREAVVEGLVSKAVSGEERGCVAPVRCGLGEETDHLFAPGETPDSWYVFMGHAPLTRRERRAVEAVRDRWGLAGRRSGEAQQAEASIARPAGQQAPLGITGASLASDGPGVQGTGTYGEGPPKDWNPAFLAEVERELKEGAPRRGGDLRVHYMRGSALESGHVAVREYLERVFGAWESGGPMSHFPESERFRDGVMICHCREKARRERVYGDRFAVVIPGVALDSLDWLELLGLVAVLASVEIRWTRLDLAFDDYFGLVDVERFRAAARAGQVTKFRTFTGTEGWRISSGKAVADNDGLTMGSRQSEKLVRVYNKELESEGRVKCIRIEVEYRGALAEAAGAALSLRDDPDSFATTVGHLVSGAVDVREVEGDGHLDRRERVKWWQEVLDLLGTCRLRVKDKIKSVIRTVNTARLQYGAVFRSLVCRIGPTAFMDLFAEGRGSLRFERMMDEAPEEVRELVCGAAVASPGGGFAGP